MTVSTTHSRVTLIYSGPGLYPFDFPVFSETDIVVYYVDVSDQQVLMSLGVNYTVDLNPDGTGEINLTYDVTPVEGEVQISRVLSLVQLTDWINNSRFDVEILEDDFDRLIMILQQLDTTLKEGLSPEEAQTVIIAQHRLRGRYSAGNGPVESIAKGNLSAGALTGGVFVGFDTSGNLVEVDMDQYSSHVQDHPLQLFWGAGAWAEDDESGTEISATREVHGVQFVMRFPTITPASGTVYQCWINGSNTIYVVNRKTKAYDLRVWLGPSESGGVGDVKLRAALYQFGSSNSMNPPIIPGTEGTDFTINPDHTIRSEYVFDNFLPATPGADDNMLIAIALARIEATAEFDKSVDVYAAALQERP